MSFIEEPPTTPEVQALYDDDVVTSGHVMNTSRVWAHAPAVHDGLFDLMGDAVAQAGLDLRQRAVLVVACAARLGDSYCSLAWGSRLAAAADPEVAAGVLRGDDVGLTAAEWALAVWARQVAGDANAITAADVTPLRDHGFSDAQIFAITVFLGLRIAFSTVNDALGAQPDAAFHERAPTTVLDAVTYGRPNRR